MDDFQNLKKKHSVRIGIITICIVLAFLVVYGILMGINFTD